MPLVKVKDLIDRVSIALQDRTNVRWPRVDLLTYLNDAQRQIVLHRPDANSVTAPFACVNSSKQSVPANGLRLLAVKRNIGGRTITPMAQSVLDIQLPNWHQIADDGDGVEHYIYDAIDPKTFYLYPVPAAAHSIEIVYSTAPADILAEAANVIALDDIYANVIMDWMLYRAYEKDAPSGDVQKATLKLQAFNSALGIKTQVDAALAQRAPQ
jgi:hypothetical protein